MSSNVDLDISLFLPEKESVQEKLAETAAKIAFHNFQWRYVTLILFNSTLLCGIELFVRLYNKSIVISKGRSFPNLADETRQYVVFGNDFTSVTVMLHQMQEHQFDNTGKYIVICQSVIPQECDENEAMKFFWNNKINNLVFIKTAASENRVLGYTNVQQDKQCECSSASELSGLNFCFDSNNVDRCQLFPEKFVNLRKCPITVSTFIQPPYMMINDGKPKGADGDLLCIIAEKLNASLNMMTPQHGDGWGSLGRDGNWIGSLGDVQNDLANFSMTFPAVTLSRFSHFQMSVYYNYASIGWVTHPTELLPSSLKLLRPFKPMTLLVLAITFSFVILSATITKSKLWSTFSRNMKMTRPQSGLVFYSWTICMGLPTNKLPKKAALLHMALFWIWYAFLVRTFYQASLVNSLKTNLYYTNFENIEEAIEVKYPYGGGASLRDYYIDYPLVYNDYINMNTSDIFLTMVKVSKGFKYVLSVNLEHAYSFIHDQGDLHIVPQKIVISPTVIFFKKFSPLAKSVNHLLRKLIEAGFTDKLYKNYSQAHKSPKKPEDNRTPMNVDHYTGCYAVLLTGWIISTAVLTVEICLENLKKYKPSSFT